MIDILKYQQLYAETLSVLKLDATQVRAGAGGACLLHGIRPSTGDLDLELTREVFDQVVKEHDLVVQHLDNGWVLANVMEDVDIHPVDESPLEGIFVGDVFTTSLQQTLDFKLRLNRPKDQDDIDKLYKILQELDFEGDELNPIRITMRNPSLSVGG